MPIGLPEDIRELQRVRNLIMQQRIDMIHKNLNSPTLSEEDIGEVKKRRK